LFIDGKSKEQIYSETSEEIVYMLKRKTGKGWEFLDCESSLPERLNVIYFGDDLDTYAFKFFAMVAKDHNMDLTWNYV
jgi:hypothetical protein